MAVSLKHAFVSAKSDGTDSTLVQPSNWNAEHTLTMATSRLLGRTTAGTGAAEEITVGSNLTFSSTSLSLSGTLTGLTSVSATTMTATDLTASGAVTFSGNAAAKMPSGTTAQRPTPTTGMFRFNTSLGNFEGYNGTAWGAVGGGATGGGNDQVFIQNQRTVTTNYTIPSNQNAFSVGPITVNSGVTVIIPSNSRWVVL